MRMGDDLGKNIFPMKLKKWALVSQCVFFSFKLVHRMQQDPMLAQHGLVGWLLGILGYSARKYWTLFLLLWKEERERKGERQRARERESEFSHASEIESRTKWNTRTKENGTKLESR